MQGKDKEQFALFGTLPLEEVLPQGHPLRTIRALFDEVWHNLGPAFETSYGTSGNVSIPPPVLLRAWLLRALYSIKSERALCEQIAMNVGFRWIVGLDWDDKVFNATVLCKNRERLFGNGAAEALLGEVARLVQKRNLMQSDRLVVDGTLIKAWASHKSFQPKDGPPESGDFRGKKRSNKTHESTTDKDAKLYRKGPGMEAVLCYLGTIIVDATTGFVKAAKLTPPCGLGESAEVSAALDLAEEHIDSGQTLVGDRGFDCKKFTYGLREMGIRAHPRAKAVSSTLDGRTTSRASYQASMKMRYIVEGFFGWLKASGRLRQTMLRGADRVGWEFQLYCAAFNLRRLALLG